MSNARRALLVAAMATALLAPMAGACAGVPCGYIYPRLLFDLGERGTAYTLTSSAPLTLDGSLTFTWDITAEGLAAPNPTTPIVVTFDFPRKPAWLDLQVEPAEIPVPITPDHVQPVPTSAGTALVYTYTVPISVRATLTARPEVDPGHPPSLRILAQSSESGLYKPGFGVRDLPLALPEAIVAAAPARAPGAELRIGTPEALVLQPLALEHEGATLTLRAEGPLALWEPASLVASVERGGQAARAIDLAASIVDEESNILYTTGLRAGDDGTLPFAFTFPAPGHYRVLVAARPVPGASDLSFDPLVAEFDVVMPGVGFDAMRYPDVYRAAYSEPVSELHANPQDLPRQFEKLLRFPVLAGADSAAVQVRLGSTAGAAFGAGSIYAEVLDPTGEQVAFGKLDALTPSLDARLRAPLPAGEYRLHLYGTGANPFGVGGSTLEAEVGVFYPEEPVGAVRARGAPQPLAGGPIELGTGGMVLDLVLHEDAAPWVPMHAVLVAQDAAGRTALHPDFILTVRRADAQPGEGLYGGEVLYTTGHRHPHDGVLPWSFTPPAPGLYVVNAYAAPTPEVSTTFWQPAIASWPLRVEATGNAYPEVYRAAYHDSTSTVRTDDYAGSNSYAKAYAFPLLAGAQELTWELRISTMTMVQHIEDGGPAALTVELLAPDGSVLDPGPPPTNSGARGTFDLRTMEPGTYALRVVGAAYAPLDYSGSMSNLTFEVAYDAPPPLPAAPAAPSGDAPRAVPSLEMGLALIAVLAVALARRR